MKDKDRRRLNERSSVSLLTNEKRKVKQKGPDPLTKSEKDSFW